MDKGKYYGIKVYSSVRKLFKKKFLIPNKILKHLSRCTGNVRGFLEKEWTYFAHFYRVFTDNRIICGSQSHRMNSEKRILSLVISLK